MHFYHVFGLISLAAALASPNPDSLKEYFKQPAVPAKQAQAAAANQGQTDDYSDDDQIAGTGTQGNQIIPTTTQNYSDSTYNTTTGEAGPEDSGVPTEDPAQTSETPDAPDEPEVKCKSYGRGVGKVPHDCPEGKSKQSGLCYKPCDDGWKRVGPVCWRHWKARGRGAGTVPNNCGDKENNAGLCYPKCNAGFHGIGSVCWPDKETKENCG